jgi:hypothetical protein
MTNDSDCVDEPGVKAVTSLFLDLKHVKQASVSIGLELDLAPGDRVEFEVAIPPIPLPVEWFGSKEGRISFATLNFELDKYCGKNTVEFRIVFRSRITSKPLGYRGVSIYQLKVTSE